MAFPSQKPTAPLPSMASVYVRKHCLEYNSRVGLSVCWKCQWLERGALGEAQQDSTVFFSWFLSELRAASRNYSGLEFAQQQNQTRPCERP